MTFKDPQPPRPCRNFPTRVCASVLQERIAGGWERYEAYDMNTNDPEGVKKLYGISWPYPWPPTDPLPPGLDDEAQHVAMASASLGRE